MWIPQDASEDRHHHIFFRCTSCRVLVTACQFFGHCSEVECDKPCWKTVNDTPICSSGRCKEPDFMVVSHCLYQTFSDKEGNRFNVFFKSPDEVDSFFQTMPAKLCLQDDGVWCKFNTMIHYHHILRAHNQFKVSELTVKSKSIGNGLFRYDYISGFLDVNL